SSRACGEQRQVAAADRAHRACDQVLLALPWADEPQLAQLLVLHDEARLAREVAAERQRSPRNAHLVDVAREVRELQGWRSVVRRWGQKWNARIEPSLALGHRLDRRHGRPGAASLFAGERKDRQLFAILERDDEC